MQTITNNYFKRRIWKFKDNIREKLNTKTIALAAMMLALTIVIVKFVNFNLYLGIGNKGKMVIGFGFLPNVIFSFFHGPLFGFIFGWIADTTTYILNGGFYSPIMALEKPLVGLIAGIAGLFYYRLLKAQFNLKKFAYFFAVMQLALISLLFFSYYLLFFKDFTYSFSLKNNKVFSVQWNVIYPIIFGIFITSLILVIEVILILILIKTYREIKIKEFNSLNNALVLIVIVLMQLSLTVINSWILTPLHYLVFFEIDFIISLLPRLIKEIILLPLRVFVYFIILKVILKLYYDKYFCKL